MFSKLRDFCFIQIILVSVLLLNCSIDRSPIFQGFINDSEDIAQWQDGIAGYQGGIEGVSDTVIGDDGAITDHAALDASKSDAKIQQHNSDSGTSRVETGAQDEISEQDASAEASGQELQPDIEPVITSAGEAYGDWTYYEVEEAVCRDGSPAGYYIRDGTTNNLMIFLNGGGVCYDDFLCAANPANVNQSLPGANVGEATMQTFFGAMFPERQVPPEAGIFKKDERNPVADWTMVYVPYCTGDVYGGTKLNSPVVTSNLLPPQQFVGYTNLGLFYRSFGASHIDAEKVLLAGSSAGGFGTLLSFDRTQEFFKNSKVIAITDSGIPFSDAYVEPCLQKIWRELWSLDDIMPEGCLDCFNPDGGGLSNLAKYIINEKYKGRVLGGLVSSKQDEIMKLFLSPGLNNCTTNTAVQTMAAIRGISSYPQDRYPAGLKDFLENAIGKENCGSYLVDGTAHQFLFRDEFYLENGVGMILADWVREIISGKAVHVGTLEEASPDDA